MNGKKIVYIYNKKDWYVEEIGAMILVRAKKKRKYQKRKEAK